MVLGLIDYGFYDRQWNKTCKGVTLQSTFSTQMPFQSEPTLVPGIVLSDLSIVEQGTGKRSIIGSFDQLVFPQFPATYGRFFVTAWIANIAGTFDEMELTCRIEDKASAHVIFSTSTKIQFPAQQTFDNSAILALSTAIMGAVFQREALYTIVLLLNGEETGRRDFNVRLIQRPSPPQIQSPLQ